MDTTLVPCDLDICRRLVIDKADLTLVRVVKAPTGKTETLQQLDEMRGHVLLEVHGAIDTQISAERTLEGLIEDLDLRGHAHLIDELELLFQRPDPGRLSAAEEARQKKCGLFDPPQLETELTEQVLLAHLQPRGYRKRPIRNLGDVTAGACFYFSHPNWQLHSLGALLKLQPRSLKELDLRDNALSDVGADLSRFELLVDLCLDGNRIKDVELHYLPR
jgi:hypothetical protein